MIIRNLDINHDFQFGKGIQSYLKDDLAIGLNIKTRLLSFLRDCYFDQLIGVDWVNLLGRKATEEEVILSCRGIILQSEGVVQIQSLEADLANRNLVLTYEVDTIFSRRFSDNLEVS